MGYLKLVSLFVLVVQAISWTDAKACGIADIVLILDESTSIRSESYNQQLVFVRKMVESLNIAPGQSQLGILSFASHAKTRFNLNRYTNKADLLKEVKTFKQMTGDTHTWEALELARKTTFKPKNGARPDKVPQIAFVITDGNSQQPDDTAKQAKLTRAAGIDIYAIGVGGGISDKELLNIAGTREKVLLVDDYDHLVEAQHRILDRFCADQPNDQGLCAKADVAFVMDTPNARQVDLAGANEFMRVITKELEIGDRVKVASVPTECVELAKFKLNAHDTKEKVLDALQLHKKSKSGLTSLLSMARSETFTSANGGRSDAKKVIVLVTDGKPGHVSELQAESEKLKSDNFEVFVLGVGDAVDANALKKVATSENHYIAVSDYESLRKKKDDVVAGVCKHPAAKKTKRTLESIIEELSMLEEASG
ncbi:matrilin-1-like [Tubulanus polymorphus]|uniref:matrilin-1-like n=1 Tax=Tubulanus polymorphus TaxID=672921 RepID=UPI003DA2192A